MDETRRRYLTHAIQLSVATIVWNMMTAVAALASAIALGSLSLAGLGFNAILDSMASAALVWRFGTESRDPARAEHIERIALTIVGWTLVAIALFLAVEAVHSLVVGREPEDSVVGIAVAAAAVVVLVPLAYAKRQVSHRLVSRALKADSTLSAMGAALGAVALLGTALFHVFGWGWCDAVAGLIIAALLMREGFVSLHAED